MGKKRERKRVPKEDRQNLRLWADGVRETVLTPHLEGYAEARDQGRRAERKFLKKVCNEFHNRVPWTTKDHEEPVLLEYDANKPKPRETLSDEQEVEKRSRMKVLDKRIRRWYTYRISRSGRHRRSAVLDSTKDPYAVLLAKLSGLSAPPKARQAFQQLMKESYEEKVAPVVAEKWALEQQKETAAAERSKVPKAGFRAQVARECFSKLPKSEQKEILGRAQTEAKEAKEAYTKALKDPPATTPEARQRCIDALGEFMAPILRGVQAYTGLHSVLLLGGPMPQYGGELRTMTVSVGRNLTQGAQVFAQWDKKRFNENVSKFMIEYLHTAFTAEECAASALSGTTADLSTAKFTIANDHNNSDSGCDSDDSDSDSDSDSNSDSSDEEENKRLRKKRKVDGKKRQEAPAAGSPPPDDTNSAGPLIYLDGLTYDEYRERNIRTAKAKLAELDKEHRFAEILAPIQNTRAKQPRPRARTTKDSAPTRKSMRNRPADGMDVDDVDSVAPTTSAPEEPAITSPDTTITPSASATQSSPTSQNVPSPATSLAVGEELPPLPVNVAPPPINPSMLQTTSSPTPSASSLPRPSSPRQSTSPGLETLPATPANTTLPSAPRTGTSTVPTCPAKAAPWFVAAHASMTAVDLGCHFNALLEAWTRVEDASRFEQGMQKLSNRVRPKEVGIWINKQRGKIPEVKEVGEYAAAWRIWWASLQPAWRVMGSDGRWEVTGGYGPDGKEWGPLFRWGVNGTLSIVASLYFWGCALPDSDPDARTSWETEVQDVVWMLEGLATYYEMWKRRF
ncbi:hypothetical protein C8R43DRAFT_958954 [Mycena crocata]|nr:hypothetical protein C8R43DRAFT_958954 [Mycena crocata]